MATGAPNPAQPLHEGPEIEGDQQGLNSPVGGQRRD